MSKYNALWEHVQQTGSHALKLSFEDIRAVCGFEIDHPFLNFKKELLEYGYEVGKISLKERTVSFSRLR